MLKSISGDARRHLRDRNMYYRRQRRPDSDVQDTPAYSDERWSLGMNNSNAKSRTFRVVMPLGAVLDIIDHADIEHFLQKEGVRCHWKCVDASWDHVYNIRATGLIGLDWWRVGGPYVEVRTVELAANFMTDMTRYQVNPPETSGRLWEERESLGLEVLRMWREILVSTKKEQMQLALDKFPEESFLPWGLPRELNEMPVALWIKRQPSVCTKHSKRSAWSRWRCNRVGVPRRTWDSGMSLRACVRRPIQKKRASVARVQQKWRC